MKNTEAKNKLVARFPYLTINPQTPREMTNNLRRALAHHFPGVKFSVKQERGTFLTSVRVGYTDGPTKSDVEKIACLFKYDDSECDPMTDYHEYNPTEFTRTFGGFTFVFIDRETSPEVREALRAEVLADIPEFPEGKNITKDEFCYIYLKGVPATVVEKYTKILQGAYWINTETLIRFLFMSRSYMPEVSAASPVERPVAGLNPAGGVEIVDYSEKAVAVFGDTKAIKDTLKQIGGRFNRALSHGGQRCAGWIFSKNREADLRAALNASNN